MKPPAGNGSALPRQAKPQDVVAGAHWRATGPSIATAALLGGIFTWSYWPVCGELIHAWNTEPDYSHGWFVVPLVIYMLWTRRTTMPGRAERFAWGGALLIALSLAVRVVGSACYIDSVEAWSIPFWVAGAFWLAGGPRMVWWSLPAVAFLGFMIPLPFHAEHWLSYPLQRVATTTSCWLLQCLAQPAVQEGNVVLIGDVRLNIVEACSGLRIFVSIVALAYLYCVLIKKPWWTKGALFAAVLPIAITANALRITLTGLLHRMVSGEAAHRFSHDLAGWLMLPVAGLMLAFVIWYIDRLIQEVETVGPGDLLRSGPPQMA
ncbi:MAG TPA: exosortase/archaeosortase family protein [Pirellulales bacterium]|jgi:exosortase|nr:exosortase/archaeosortase family protein [Pirellulales bacterium]